MGISAVVALGAATVATSYMGAEAQKDAAESAANQQREQAAIEQQNQIALANQQQAQAKEASDRQIAAEAARQQAAKDTLDAQAATTQNSKVSDLTPTVQLASDAGGSQSAANARKRRAQFRPEYSSGVTI